MLLNILESYPREELFQIDAEELYEAATAILDIQDRQRLRLLVRRDMFGRFMSCLVYLPRDRLTTGLRTRIQDILQAAFHGVSTQYATQVSESVLARLHITVQTEPGTIPEYDVAEIEARLVAAMRSWGDDLYDALVDQLGEEHGVALHDRYADAFPPAYQHDTSAAAAVVDIGRIEGLGGGDDVAMHLYRPLEAAPGTLRFKLFRHGQSVTLSDVLPLLENMGVHVIDERPYEVRPAGAEPVWIYDFGLRHDQLTDLESEGCASASRRPSPWSGAATWRTTGSTGWCSAPGCGGARSPSCGRTRSTSDRSAPRSPWTTPSPRWRTTPSSPAGSTSSSGSGSIPTTRWTGTWPPSTSSTTSRADSTPSPASTRTGSSAPCCGSCRRRCGRTTSRPGRTVRAGHGSRSSSRRARSPTCPSRARRSRSSSTRPGSRASTCAVGPSPAAACAGRTGRRTSARRCSG